MTRARAVSHACTRTFARLAHLYVPACALRCPFRNPSWPRAIQRPARRRAIGKTRGEILFAVEIAMLFARDAGFRGIRDFDALAAAADPHPWLQMRTTRVSRLERTFAETSIHPKSGCTHLSAPDAQSAKPSSRNLPGNRVTRRSPAPRPPNRSVARASLFFPARTGGNLVSSVEQHERFAFLSFAGRTEPERNFENPNRLRKESSPREEYRRQHRGTASVVFGARGKMVACTRTAHARLTQTRERRSRAFRP